MNTDTVSATALRVTCLKAELSAALAVVSRAVSSRGAVQVLGGILLHAEEGKLSLAATDMEISIRASLEGEIEGDASVVVPGRLLTDLVRLLPDESVTLAYDEGEGVLSVASVQSVGGHWEVEAYSNRGEWIDVCAVGTDVESVNQRNQPVACSGTSFAAPFVSARIAALASGGIAVADARDAVANDPAQPLVPAAGRLVV